MDLLHPHGQQGRGILCVRGIPARHDEVFVQAGTLLGYQGNYSGDPVNPTGLHLHISVVKDDGRGGYLNELETGNTYDPSPYFGLPLDHNTNPNEFPVCDGAVVIWGGGNNSPQIKKQVISHPVSYAPRKNKIYKMDFPDHLAPDHKSLFFPKLKQNSNISCHVLG